MGEFWWTATQRGARTSSPEWARDGELAAAAFLAREGEAEGNGRVHFARGVAMEVMRRPELTSGARNDVRTPNVPVALPPVGHVDELGSDSDKTMTDWESYFDNDFLPNQNELGDGVLDKVGVLAELYNIVNWSKS